jgi:uncharacterized membrane protein YeaQ/YmgE (transglycosylase-associated protein family)
VIVVLILAILLSGLFAGGVAWLLRGGPASNASWLHDLTAGVVGSYLGAMVGSLLAGDALRLHWVDLAGSVAGSVVLLRVWRPAPPPRRPNRR